MKFELMLMGIIFIAGCVNFGGTFGSDVVTVQTRETFDPVSDLVSFGRIETIPKSPIPPDTNMILSLILENNDDSMTVGFVKEILFDAPGFKGQESNQECNANPDNCLSRNFVCDVNTFCSLRPKEQKQITYYLKSPDTEIIKTIGSSVVLNFLATYYVQSFSEFTFPVVDFKEIENRQRGEQALAVEARKTHGKGPVIVDTELVGSPYLVSGQPGKVRITMRNAGGGEIITCIGSCKDSFFQDNKIKMTVKFEGVSALPTDPSMFREKSPNEFETTRDISFINKEAAGSFLFNIMDPQSDGNPFASKKIDVTLEYFYEIRGSAPVNVQPFGNQ